MFVGELMGEFFNFFVVANSMRFAHLKTRLYTTIRAFDSSMHGFDIFTKTKLELTIMESC